MEKQIKGLLYFFLTDARYSIAIFWSINIGIIVLSLSISYFLVSVEGEFYLSASIPMYIYCAIFGYITVKESIPFALKIGATRKSIFISIGLFFLILSGLKAVFMSIIHSTTLAFADAVGISNFLFIHPATLLGDTWLNRLVVDASIMFLVFSMMFIIGLVFYRTGLAGGGIVAGIIVLLLLFGIAEGWLFEFISDLIADVDLTLFVQMFGVGIVFYLLSFLFVRRITIIKTK